MFFADFLRSHPRADFRCPPAKIQFNRGYWVVLRRDGHADGWKIQARFFESGLSPYALEKAMELFKKITIGSDEQKYIVRYKLADGWHETKPLTLYAADAKRKQLLRDDKVLEVWPEFIRAR